MGEGQAALLRNLFDVIALVAIVGVHDFRGGFGNPSYGLALRNLVFCVGCRFMDGSFESSPVLCSLNVGVGNEPYLRGFCDQGMVAVIS